MAVITWNDIQNGEDGLSVRVKINNFNTSALTGININTNDIIGLSTEVSNYNSRITQNEIDITQIKTLNTNQDITISSNTDKINILENQGLSIKTSDYTIISTDKIILIDATSGDINITLPSSIIISNTLNIKRIDNSVNIVNVISSDLIDIVNSIELTSMDNLTVISNQIQYYII